MTRNPVAAGNPGTGPDRRSVASPRPALRGAFTALVTPFAADGGVDEAAFRALAEWQVLAGIDGLVPVGTTGEAPTLSPAERDRLIEIAVAAAAASPAPRRPLVVAGTGTNDTRASIEATRRAAALGADAALVVAPYYNRPDQRMLEAHFRAIADEGGLPIVVYNVPSRTGTNVEADTFLRLAEHPRVTAVKEASGNIEQLAVICRDRPRDVAVLAGDDAATLAVLAMGGDGVVSVAGNQVPGAMAALCAAARAGDWDEARRLHARWLPLFRANFQGAPNPVPAKAALLAMGLIERDDVRAPLLPLAAGPRARLVELLRTLGLVDGGGSAARGSRRGRRGQGDGRGRVPHDRARRRPGSGLEATILDDLDAGTPPRRVPRPRRARRLARRPGGQGRDPRPVPRSRDDHVGPRRGARLPRPRRGAGQAPARRARGRRPRSRPAARGGSSPAGPACGPAPTSARAWWSCRRRS